MDIVERAKELAHRAHAGQVDKAGRPYIEHVARVAAAVADDPEAEAVAWLHDVIEDCPGYHDEVSDTFPMSILIPLNKITRWPWMKGDALQFYYVAIRANQIALRVKLADVADNADESRLALLDETTAARLRKKYAKTLAALGHNA